MTDTHPTPVSPFDVATTALGTIAGNRNCCDPENDGWKGVAHRMADAAEQALTVLAGSGKTRYYLISHTTDDGDDASLVVEATHEKEAVELWRTWDFLDSLYEGQLPSDYKVFALPEKSGTPGAKLWHEDLVQVAP